MKLERRLAVYIGSAGKDIRECFPWLGFYKPRRGRPIPYIYHKGKQRPAQRVVYEHYYGPIPSKHIVYAICNNDSCTNFRHLRSRPRGRQ